MAGDALDLGALRQVLVRLRAGELPGRLDFGAYVPLHQRGVALDNAVRDGDYVQAGDAQLGDLLRVNQGVAALGGQLGFGPACTYAAATDPPR